MGLPNLDVQMANLGLPVLPLPNVPLPDAEAVEGLTSFPGAENGVTSVSKEKENDLLHVAGVFFGWRESDEDKAKKAAAAAGAARCCCRKSRFVRIDLPGLGAAFARARLHGSSPARRRAAPAARARARVRRCAARQIELADSSRRPARAIPSAAALTRPAPAPLPAAANSSGSASASANRTSNMSSSNQQNANNGGDIFSNLAGMFAFQPAVRVLL